MSPATSRSTRWPGGARSSGLSTRGSRASARSTGRPASCHAGGRRSSRRLEPSDRCHLNGLAMVDGRPRYATASGNRHHGADGQKKATGGILMDVPSGEVCARAVDAALASLAAGRLWVCESGAGTLGFIDPNTMKYEADRRVPGFTRGLDFAGNLAFVGLSQVRETAVFSGIPITERLDASRADLRRLRGGPERRSGGGAAAVRGRRAGGLRRPGAARRAVSGADQRRQKPDGELVRPAR